MAYRKVSRRDAKRANRKTREAAAERSAAAALAAENTEAMFKERRKPPKSFLSKYEGTCATCFTSIHPGQRVHYGPMGLVHHRHEHAEPAGEPCPGCWLVHGGGV